MLRCQRIHSLTQMRPLIPRWNELAGSNPFLRWEWLGTWWNHYGGGHELAIVAVRDARGSILGFAPWYVERRLAAGRTIRFLGSGKVCTDHLSVLASHEAAPRVAHAIAEWLLSEDPGTDRPLAWNQLELIGVDAEDRGMRAFVDRLAASGAAIDQRPGIPCYFLDMADGWEAYLRRRSKSGRRFLRGMMERISSDGFTVREFCSPAEFEEAWPTFVALHQKRRHDLGQTGCFDHPPFGDFLYDAGRELAGAGLLRLVIVAQGAAPVAVEFLLTTATTTFLYQAGMDPDYGSVRPGLLAMTYCLHSTAQRGATGVDMLRGEEPYKERWRATPSNTVELRVARPELAARLRHQLWVSSTAIKVWLKRRLPQRRTTDKQRVQAAGGVSDP